MNDLRTLSAALAQDEPSQDVVDRSRHRLQNHMRGHRPIRRRSWLAITAAATAAVMVAVVVALPAGDPPPAPSGRDILLAAADVAERSPEGSGTYWYYKVEAGSHRYEFWIKPDGRHWYRYAGGKVEQQPDRLRHPFSLIGVPLTLDQLRALPTEPEALRAWIAETVADHDGGDAERNTLDSLVSLVSMLPAPPEVRAAAFRAIAAYPGVEYLGDVPGGRGVLLPMGDILMYEVGADGPVEQRLVVDPATGRANGTTFYVNGGARIMVGERGAKITAEWTDSLPS